MEATSVALKKELVKFVHSFAYSFITVEMSSCHMLGSVLSTGDKVVKKMLSLPSKTFLEKEAKGINKWTTKI